MLTIDIIGVVVTICFIGIRYPHYAILAIMVHDFARVSMAVFLNGHIDTVVAAGAFSAISVTSLDELKRAVIAFAGPLASYAVSAMAGGSEFERTSHIFKPTVHLQHPLSVINLRLALVSIVVTTWYLYWQ
jgi:hypothetical protein